MNASEAVRLIDRATLPSAVQGRQAGRMRTAAGALSRRTLYAAKAALCMRRLHEFTALLYEADAAGELINVDGATGRILLPSPWGRLGHATWGLTAGEGAALRHIVRSWGSAGAALFWYDAGARSWCIDLDAFPTAAAAHDSIEERGISVPQWRAAWTAAQRGR